MAKALNVVGLMNVQFAIQGDVSAAGEAASIYVLEVNPRGLAHGAVRLEGDRRSRSPRSRRAAWPG